MITIIAAMGKNGVIGDKGELPWLGKLPTELKRFKKFTMGNIVIMGRKTYESIGEILPDRINIVLSRQKELSIPGATIFNSLERALDFTRSNLTGEIFIMGGGEIFKEGLKFADRVFLSVIDLEFNGDTFFPKLGQEWKEVSREKFKAGGKDLFDWEFVVFERKKYVNLKNARDPEYRRGLEEIKEAGICPFCPKNLKKWHKSAILKRAGNWIITPASLQKYDDIKFRFLLIGDEHKESFEELNLTDLSHIKELIIWVIKEYGIKGYGLTLRSGDMDITGASVCHLHFHLIVPEDNKVVNFPIG